MVKAKENTAEFKHSLCIWCPHGKMKVRRPIYPANVPKHIMTSLAICGTFPFPMENLCAFLPSCFRTLTMAMAVGLFIYFHSESFTLPDSLLRFTSSIMSGDSPCFITSISLLQALPGEGALCLACEPHLFS